MSVHPIFLVDRGPNIVLEVIGGNPDVNAAGNFERLPFLGGYIALFLGAAGDSLGVGLRVDRFSSGS
jgi:hypothetical protein